MSDVTEIKMPSRFEYWTVDEVAECVSYQKHLDTKEKSDALYCKLWGFLEQSENKTPLGGDGSNGPVEEPYEHLSDKFGDKITHWWDKLSTEEQEALAKGAEEL